MSRDFYVVLGVSPGADLDQIKSAYRKLVKLYHPDRGPQPVERFIEVRKAYESLLSGDLTECETEPESEKEAASAEPLVVHRSGRAPVTAQARQRREPLTEQVDGSFTKLDEFFAGWVPGLFRSGRGAARRKELYVELALAPSEAQAGGLMPLRLPVESTCPVCQGQRSGMLVCATCQGRGRVVDYHAIEISVPPGVADGTRTRLSLRDVGLPDTLLHVLVTVER